MLNGKDCKMNSLEKECWNLFRRMGHAYNFPDVMTKVMAVLYMQPEEIAMEEVAKKTKYSLASVSNTVKRLETIGVVQKRRKPGSKKVYLYLEKNLAKLNIQKLRAAKENFIGPIRKILPERIEKYEGAEKDKKSKEQLNLMKDYFMQLKKFEELFEKWEQDLEEVSREISSKLY